MQARAADLEAGHASAIRITGAALEAAGVEVPRMIGATVSGGRELLVFEFVPGRPGPELLADPVRGPALARSMGRLARSLAAIVTAAIPADPAWTAPDMLQRASQAWLHRLGREAQVVAADGAVADAVTGALAEVGRIPWTAVVTHGDYVPANVLVADDGALTLLDLGSVAGRHPALDAAWWALIVRHHHPDLAPALTQAFRTEAWERDVAPEDRLLASLALVRALHLAADREPGDHRRHLLALAASAVTWTGSVARGS